MSLNLDKSTWTRVRFGDVVRPSKEKWNPDDPDVTRYVAGEHMDTDNLRIERWGEIGDGYLGPAFRRRFRPGQVLYGSRRTYLRKIAVADFDGVCANTTFVLDAIPGKMLQAFLPFVMSSEPFHAFSIAESKGSVNPYVNWSDLATFEFDLPPLNEQKRIADLLWAVERHREALVNRARVTETALVEFLGIYFAKSTEKKVSLRSLCASVVGGIWGSPEGEAEIDVLALGPRVYADGAIVLDPTGSPMRSFTRRQLEERLVQPGDIVLERSGGSPTQAVGRVVIARDGLPACVPTDFQRLLRPDSSVVEPWYLYWRLRYDWAIGATRNFSRKTTNISNLAVQEYLSRSIPLPDLEEQCRVVSRIEDAVGATTDARREESTVVSLRSALLTEIFGGAA